MDTRLRLADKNGSEIGYLDGVDVDIDVGADNDFELNTSVQNWDKQMTFDSLVYIEETGLAVSFKKWKVIRPRMLSMQGEIRFVGCLQRK